MGRHYSPHCALVVTARDLFPWDRGAWGYRLGPFCPVSTPLYPLFPLPPLSARLVLRRLYPLAIQICEYLRLPEVQGVSRILAHWACYKVRI